MFEAITGFMSWVLSPLATFQPHIGLFILTAFIALTTFGINRIFVNRKAIKSIKERMTEIREQLTQAQKAGDKETVNKFLNEYIEVNSQYMRQTIKVMAISMVIIVIFLPFINSRYGTTVILLPFSLPIIGAEAGWAFWYFLGAVTISWTIQKFLGD